MKITRFIFQIIPFYHPQNMMCLIWFAHLGSVLPLGSHHLGISVNLTHQERGGAPRTTGRTARLILVLVPFLRLLE